MSTYTVTDSVSQVILGGQSTEVSLLNKGPSTIYLDDTTAVSVLNGMALPPMGQMTWNAQSPLWAVAATGGSAVLQINDAAGRIDANRAKFWSLLETVTNSQGSTTITAECGHCETILIKMHMRGGQASTAAGPTIFRLNIQWLDEIGNIIDLDHIDVAQLVVSQAQNPSDLFIRIPVIGTFISFQWVQTNGATVATVETLQIFGSDRALPFRWYCANSTGANVLAWKVNDTPTVTGDAFMFSGITTFTDIIWMANLGNTIHINITANNATGGGNARKDIREWAGAVVFDTILIPTVAANVNYTEEFIIPQKTVMQVANNGGLGGTAYDIGVTWKE